ncbi:MAG: hypothetical protein M3Q00_09795 [Pseudomonadota bacterium]|nr:hypothetical protein [Pseudomonadota bacterium]
MMFFVLFSAVGAALAVTAVSAADDKVEPPPEVQELDPITVEEKRPEEDQPKKVDPEKRLKEELAKDKKVIEEIKNARGQGRVKVKGPFFSYCLNYDNSNPLTQNSVGVSVIVPVYCGPGQK